MDLGGKSDVVLFKSKTRQWHVEYGCILKLEYNIIMETWNYILSVLENKNSFLGGMNL